MLQVQSRRKCRRVFGRVDAWIEKSISASLSFREEDRMQLLDKYAKVCNETDIELGEAMEYRHSLINLCMYIIMLLC